MVGKIDKQGSETERNFFFLNRQHFCVEKISTKAPEKVLLPGIFLRVSKKNGGKTELTLQVNPRVSDVHSLRNVRLLQRQLILASSPDIARGEREQRRLIYSMYAPSSFFLFTPTQKLKKGYCCSQDSQQMCVQQEILLQIQCIIFGSILHKDLKDIFFSTLQIPQGKIDIPQD